MTDISSVQAHAESQPASVALYGGPPPPAFANGLPAFDGTIEEEESSTIKCICGFSDDDGNTVLCEKCDTWQHIVCYYKSPDDVPDVHECTDCSPRHIDTKSATEKQRQRRELISIGERKTKPKTAPKSHKKRVKDPLGSVQPNGWAVHSNNESHYSVDRKSGSPRDQTQPPTKRPKTSHRASGSVSMLSQTPSLAPGSRKRAGSTMHNGHSPVKSPIDPDGPTAEEFSPEFMQLYRHDEPPCPDTNSYTDLSVTNDISSWQNDRDALSEATGMGPDQVFMGIDKPIEEFEATAPVLVKQMHEDPSITVHGLHPQWRSLTVETEIPSGAFIGELRGRIGRKDDYFSEPANRWDLLRHPEPFVFFPPHLPIYIDTREEGTILRYTRRSCNPNMTMKILTQGSGVHFCFVAIHPIFPDDTLTIGWELDKAVIRSLKDALSNGGNIRKDGFKKIEPWVACALSNYGGCACRRGHDCLFECVRRSHHEPVQAPKTIRSKKNKKAQVSPLSTGHATNSRAGSEAFNREGPEDENMDSRSTSGSHSKPSSRDITPATHFSVDGDVKMSDRERRKIQQQERLFEQLEYDEQHKGKRGAKRNSAGSTLNTPSLSISKQLGHSEPSPSARHPREHSHGVARKTSSSSTKPNGRTIPRPKPVYADASTQTDCSKNNSSSSNPSNSANGRIMKPPISRMRRLLERADKDRLQRERLRAQSLVVKTEAKSPVLNDVSSTKPSPAPALPEQAVPMVISTKPEADVPGNGTPAPTEDVEMKDADEVPSQNSMSPKVEEMPDAPEPESEPSPTSHPPIQPPPPPLPTVAPPTPLDATAPAESLPPAPNAPVKPVGLQVQLPPVPDMSVATTPTTVVTPGSVSSVLTSSAIAQSPIGTAPGISPFSPSVTNAVNPPRKKLSLSDYANRRKMTQKSPSNMPTIPASASAAGSSPTMSHKSLPGQESPSTKPVESSTLPAVSEEQKPIEDSKPPLPATATISTTST
ncbi:hypothetical protein P154DRAFT_431323 [Amniculicola lignicola CBS 123094]|uniref:SET domain-containing protein n=1 Tax=Amniculicola lignicola CBS 123094 TaxID=1392246 RepID=A0A6A5WQ95_9PLEO|nr:hypothetical protein P154DRAFT_431323 [Amniculicola lignicola CBS 123094]